VVEAFASSSFSGTVAHAALTAAGAGWFIFDFHTGGLELLCDRANAGHTPWLNKS
jgi:hypothetical protein